VEQEFMQQKHPVSKGEVQSWLEAHGFVVTQSCGDYSGATYEDASERAILWARKE
jgi:hypothetical protein